MSEHDDARKTVAEFYAKAVTGSARGGCCRDPEGESQKGVVVRLAGYDGEELQTLPPDAVANSFGCGNPVAFSEVEPGEVVVDLGCGAGVDLLLAAAKVGPKGQVIGVDMTDEMLAKARENIAFSGLGNIEVRKGFIEDLPVETSSADWVISNCVINLSLDKPKVFSEIARVLKPGGRMLVSDIVVEGLPDWVRRIPELYSSCVAGAISEAGYIAGLQQAGFENVEVRQRLVYDRAVLGDLVRSELPGTALSTPSNGGRSLEEAAADLVAELAGKVWSASFSARKPSA